MSGLLLQTFRERSLGGSLSGGEGEVLPAPGGLGIGRDFRPDELEPIEPPGGRSGIGSIGALTV